MRIAFKIMYILYGWCPAGPTGGRRRRRLATDPTPIRVRGGDQGRLWGGTVDGWLAPLLIGPVGWPQYAS